MAGMGLRVHSTPLQPGWIDYNDHLTEGYYGVVFADAGDALLERVGFDDAYRAVQRGTFYTVETHVRFVREVPKSGLLAVFTIVLGADAKRLHLFHTMVEENDGFVAATQESLLLHVNIDSVRVTPMADEILDAIQVLAAEHGDLPRPDGVGAAIVGDPRPG